MEAFSIERGRRICLRIYHDISSVQIGSAGAGMGVDWLG